MPDPVKFAKAKKRLRRCLRKIVREHQQIRRDIEWWNEYRTDAAPFDVGGTIVAERLAQQCLDLVEAERPLPDSLWNQLTKQLEANARA